MNNKSTNKIKLSVVVPIRKGSERSKNKNIKQFTSDGLSLTELKIKELLKIEKVNEIILTTNDEIAISQIEKLTNCNQNLKIMRRPDNLCQSTTLVKDLINYIPTITKGEHILWLHVTSPFVKAEDYEDAIEKYFQALEDGYDSIMSVTEHKQFLWSATKKRIINTDDTINKWPNTQDLEPLYEINHAFYINSRENYLKTSDRIGDNPYLYILEGEKTIDIDWEKDFIFAQKVWQCMHPND